MQALPRAGVVDLHAVEDLIARHIQDPGNEVLGGTATRPETIGTLPRTGGDPRPLTAGGLWALGAGGLALTAARWLRPRSRSWYRQQP